MADTLDRLPAFEAAVRARLDAGRVAYGDKSFIADPAVLIRELQAEACDLAGWGYVLWCRLEAMRQALRDLPPTTEAAKSEPMPEHVESGSRGSGYFGAPWQGCEPSERPPSEPPGRMVGAERNS